METQKTPLKRVEELKSLSREHHFSLLFCWKIKTGIINGTDVKRIAAYSRYFFFKFLKPHFRFEEEQLFPILERGDKMVELAVSQHRKLEELLNASLDEPNLLKVSKLLSDHIRLEERNIFAKIQEVATQTQLKLIHTSHEMPQEADTWPDQYWLS